MSRCPRLNLCERHSPRSKFFTRTVSPVSLARARNYEPEALVAPQSLSLSAFSAE
jgi:hypothetical protein